MNKRYRCVRGSIEAYQWLPGDLAEAGIVVGILMASGLEFNHPNGMGDSTTVRFQTPAGDCELAPGDWLVRAETGILWGFNATQFAGMFEPAHYAGDKSRLELEGENEVQRDRIAHLEGRIGIYNQQMQEIHQISARRGTP